MASNRMPRWAKLWTHPESKLLREHGPVPGLDLHLQHAWHTIPPAQPPTLLSLAKTALAARANLKSPSARLPRIHGFDFANATITRTAHRVVPEKPAVPPRWPLSRCLTGETSRTLESARGHAHRRKP
eukprot:scaffold180602_cov30-Tisochrysis_lutea.AAC.1